MNVLNKCEGNSHKKEIVLEGYMSRIIFKNPDSMLFFFIDESAGGLLCTVEKDKSIHYYMDKSKIYRLTVSLKSVIHSRADGNLVTNNGLIVTKAVMVGDKLESKCEQSNEVATGVNGESLGV